MRKLGFEQVAPKSTDVDPAKQQDSDREPKPAWLPDAACACSFDSFPGQNAASKVDEARGILEEAGIPTYTVAQRRDPSMLGPQPWYIYELMVPGALNLHALSVLDKEFFNPELEAEWKTHFAALSDDDFHAVNLKDLTAGFEDRIQRLTKAYNDERELRAR